MKNKILLIKRPYLPSEKDITKLERRIGETLPTDYLDFMKKYNGFNPKDSLYCFRVDWSKAKCNPFGDDDVALNDLFSICDDKVNNLVSINEAIDNMLGCGEELIPKDTIPIGNDFGGGVLIMGVSDHNKGKVYYWFDGYPVEPGKPGYDNVGFVANSFTEFLESLQPCEDV